MQLRSVLPALFHPNQVVFEGSEARRPWLLPAVLLVSLSALSSLVWTNLSTALGLAKGAALQNAVTVAVTPLVGVAFIITCAVIYHFLLQPSPRDFRQTLGLVAWAALPLVVRQIVRIGYMTVTQTPIMEPGLSGIVAGAGGMATLGARVLEQVDIYFVWFCRNLKVSTTGDRAQRPDVWWVVASSAFGAVLIRTLIVVILGQLAPAMFGTALFP